MHRIRWLASMGVATVTAALAGDVVPQAPEELALEQYRSVAARDGGALRLKLKEQNFLLENREQCGDAPCPAGERLTFSYHHFDAATGHHFVQMQVDRGAYRWLRIGAQCGDTAVATDLNGFRSPAPHERIACPASTPPPAEQWRILSDALVAQESTAVTAAGGRVRRDGERLELTIGDGRNVLFTQHWLCGDFRCPPFLEQTYQFTAHLAGIGQYLIGRRDRSMSDWLLVDERSGRMVVTRGYPELSPDGRQLVSVQGDILRNLFAIELWEATPEGLESRFRASPGPGQGLAFVSWEGPDRVRLRTFNSLPEGGYEPAWLERSAGEWAIVRVSAGLPGDLK